MENRFKVLPKSDKPLFEERESLVTHSPFLLELHLFNAIKEGDIIKLNTAIDEYINRGFVVGNMSDNSTKLIKYWAVSTVSTSIHYAILGGLDETDAYNFSDHCIRHIDMLTSFEECLMYLVKKSNELVLMVQNSSHLSGKIKQCVHYIHIHSHEKIIINSLSELVNLSSDYLSILFKKETGYTIHDYIIKEKINESIKLIEENKPFQEISYILGFCSQTHFIKAFKKEFGMTPGQYKRKMCL